MGPRKRPSARKALSGIIAALMLFAMLFTVGTGYFLFVNQNNLALNQADATRQTALLQDRQESLAMKVGINGSTLVLSANNTGGVPTAISSIYVLDNTGKMISPPGVMGQAATNVSAAQWPLALGVGAATKALTGCVAGKTGCNIALNGYTYTSGTVFVTVVTGRGSTFSAQYPAPPLTTTTTVATTSQTFSTTTTTTAGVGGNALVVTMIATPAQIFSCSACVTDTVTVYNYASSAVTGVSLNPAVPVASVTGTATLTGGSCGAPSPSSTISAYSGSGNAPSITFTCTYNSKTGAVGGFASFAGYVQGTLNGVLISSAQAVSNNIQIGGNANVTTQGAFSANFFIFKSSSCAQSGSSNWHTPCNTSPSPFPPVPPTSLDSLPGAAIITGDSNYYVAFYVQVTNNFNSTLALLPYTFLQLDPSHPPPLPGNETDFWLAGAASTYNAQGYYYPNYATNPPTLAAYAGTTTNCAETGPSWTPSTNCIDIAAGQTVTLTFAACGFGASNWDWAGYRYANGFDNSAGCISPWPSFPASGSANILTVVMSFLYQGQTYTQDLQYQGMSVLPTPLSFATVGGQKAVACVPVTLTNSQSSATPTSFQEMITVNSNTYNTYLASNVRNVNWQDGAGNILNSWLESGNSNAATSTVYWINLASNTIAANGGTMTVYYCMYGTSLNALNTSNTGEFPTATGTYGQYDDGANVFTFYDNFAGTTLNSHWTSVTSSSSVTTQNNGITFNAGSTGNGVGLISNTAFTNPYTEEGYIVSETAGSASAYGLFMFSGTGGNGIGYQGWPSPQGSIGQETAHFAGVSGQTTMGSNFQSTGIMGLGWASAASQYESVGYTNYATSVSGTNFQATSNPALGITYLSTNTQISLQWFRARAQPPSNVMPSASFGTLALVQGFSPPTLPLLSPFASASEWASTQLSPSLSLSWALAVSVGAVVSAWALSAQTVRALAGITNAVSEAASPSLSTGAALSAALAGALALTWNVGQALDGIAARLRVEVSRPATRCVSLCRVARRSGSLSRCRPGVGPLQRSL